MGSVENGEWRMKVRELIDFLEGLENDELDVVVPVVDPWGWETFIDMKQEDLMKIDVVNTDRGLDTPQPGDTDIFTVLLIQ